jgi:hypothetical protein
METKVLQLMCMDNVSHAALPVGTHQNKGCFATVANRRSKISRTPLLLVHEFDMKSVILAFVLGLCLSTWRVHLAILLRDIYAKLQNLLQSNMESSETQFVPLPPLMVNQAVQTEHEENAKGLVKTEPTDSGKDQSHEALPESEELGKQLEVIQSDPETLELEDLNDLRDYLYENNPKAAVSASTIEPALEDCVLKSMTSAVRELFGDQVPPSCIYSSSLDNGHNRTGYAEDDFNKMKKLLRHLTCRYAVSHDNVALLRSYIIGAEHDEYFGLFKLAIDKNHLMAFNALLQHVRLENLCSELPAIFEYATLRGSLGIMEELLRNQIDADGDDSTHPLSAAVAGGSIDAVKLLLQWGANKNDSRDRKSIVKEYTQTPIVIAAHHQHTAMVKYLIIVGQPARAFEAKHDALSIALARGHATMLLCLMRSYITFTRFDPPLENNGSRRDTKTITPPPFTAHSFNGHVQQTTKIWYEFSSSTGLISASRSSLGLTGITTRPYMLRGL